MNQKADSGISNVRGWMTIRNENAERNGGLLKIASRINAWVLFAAALVLVISGWGITQTGLIYSLSFGLIDRRLANEIHRNAVLPAAFFLVVHMLINIHFSFSRKRSRTIFDVFSILVGAALLGIVVYLQYFRLGG